MCIAVWTVCRLLGPQFCCQGWSANLHILITRGRHAHNPHHLTTERHAWTRSASGEEDDMHWPDRPAGKKTLPLDRRSSAPLSPLTKALHVVPPTHAAYSIKLYYICIYTDCVRDIRFFLNYVHQHAIYRLLNDIIIFRIHQQPGIRYISSYLTEQSNLNVLVKISRSQPQQKKNAQFLLLYENRFALTWTGSLWQTHEHFR